MIAPLVLLSIYTGIVLAPIAFLAVASGYCMKSPQLVGLLTMGVLGDYNICSEIHTIIVPELLSLIGTIHVLSTAEILARKYSGLGRVLAALLNLYRASAWVLTLHNNHYSISAHLSIIAPQVASHIPASPYSRSHLH